MPAAPSTDDLAKLLAGTVRIARRVEIYESDQATLFMSSEDIGLEDGIVSVDASRDERRTLDLTITPLNPTLKVGFGSLWYDKIIRIYWGFYGVDGAIWEIRLGDFMIDTQSNDNFPSSIQITGRDLTKRLLTSKFQQTVTFTAGTSVDVIILAEAGNAGITNVLLPWGTGAAPQLALDQTFEADSTRFSCLNTLLTGLGYEIYFDANSTLVVRPFQDPATLGPSFTFESGSPNGTLSHITRKTDDSELFNHVVVRGSTDTNALVFAESEVGEISSPIHKDHIGDRVYSYPSAVVSTNDEAQTLSDQFLAVKSLESYEIDMDTIVIPWLDGGDVVGYIDPDSEFTGPTNYFLSSFTVPLALGVQSGVAKRVVSVV